MKIALVSDEWHSINEYIQKWLQNNKIDTTLFGSYLSNKDEPWVEVTIQASLAVARGQCQEGIFSCWSGTGACIVANKIPGIRAALCNDFETASLARIWNHGNVLVLSNRSLTSENANLILAKWFEKYDAQVGLDGVKQICELEKYYYRSNK